MIIVFTIAVHWKFRLNFSKRRAFSLYAQAYLQAEWFQITLLVSLGDRETDVSLLFCWLPNSAEIAARRIRQPGIRPFPASFPPGRIACESDENYAV
jgi:hypothetical protein